MKDDTQLIMEAIRWMIIGAAEHLCDELIAKLANTRDDRRRATDSAQPNGA